MSKQPVNPFFYNDRGVFRVIIFANIVIIFSMLLVGTIVDRIVEKQVVSKLKQHDLTTIAQAVAGKVDARFEQAVQMAVVLAQNPAVEQWVQGGEQDAQLQPLALDMLADVVNEYDYEKSFIVSAATNQYWAENKQVINKMIADDPDDQWFFQALASRERVSVVIDDDTNRDDSVSVFINVLIGDLEHPAGVAGVSLSIVDQARQFESMLYGDKSRIWLMNKEGIVLLSDHVQDNGKLLSEQIPDAVVSNVIRHYSSGKQIFEYKNEHGKLVDLISYPVQYGGVRIVFTIDRAETVSMLRTIQINTVIAIIISIVVVIFIFYYVSRKLSNPLKHLLKMNTALEHVIAERTREIFEQNERMSDSIDYALRIQKSLLPSAEYMSGLNMDHFVIWNPRDTVGGDFYWVKQTDNGHMIAVGDCTGHGVPGALMTMLAISILDQIVAQSSWQDPATMLMLLNRFVKDTLKQEQVGGHGLNDDGLDLALCSISGNQLIFAGAKSSLYVQRQQDVQVIAGDKRSIGYRRTPANFRYTNHTIEMKDQTAFFLTTDGLLDQDGGEHGYSFGRKRFVDFLYIHARLSLEEQKQALLGQFNQYRGSNQQRDDLTVVAFKNQ